MQAVLLLAASGLTLQSGVLLRLSGSTLLPEKDVAEISTKDRHRGGQARLSIRPAPGRGRSVAHRLENRHPIVALLVPSPPSGRVVGEGCLLLEVPMPEASLSATW